jgi:hypothetical protein
VINDEPTQTSTPDTGLAGFLLLSAPAAAWAQDALSRAKGLYATADYEEALQLLST